MNNKNVKLDTAKLFGFSQASRQGADTPSSEQGKNLLSKIGRDPGEFSSKRKPGKTK